MTELIKQRLVGMLIVVIAGVIFIPDLLDGKKELVKEEFKKVPPKPIVEQSPIVTEFPKQRVIETVNNASKVTDEVADDEPNTAEGSAPETPTAKIDTPTNPEANEEQTQSQSNSDLTSVAEPESEIVSKAQDVEFAKSAWVLRLGTFRNKPNVDALLSKLEEAGVKTFVKPVEAKAGTLYRVFVGPELDKESLESAQNTLKELTGLDGKITQFQPVN